jgi:hypothetical protein
LALFDIIASTPTIGLAGPASHSRFAVAAPRKAFLGLLFAIRPPQKSPPRPRIMTRRAATTGALVCCVVLLTISAAGKFARLQALTEEQK